MSNCKKALALICSFALAATAFSGCGLFGGGEEGGTSASVIESDRPTDGNDVSEIEVDETVYDYALVSEEDGTFIYEDSGGNTASLTVTYESGTQGCYTVSENTLTFSGLAENSVYTVTGALYGNIVIDAGDDYKLELQFTDFSLTSYTECPLTVVSADKFTLSAKKDTQNYIYDLRGDIEDGEISSSVYALCDLDIQGKGELFIKSVNNNGVHTKKDLTVKNLNLQVECKDNALKGNDSVTVESGELVLIARAGDGIKTTDSDISSKGNQRGSVVVSGGTLLIYAACDAIDASYDVTISEEASVPNIEIYTDQYSKYSEEVTAVSDGVYYVRSTSVAYKYSIRYFNDETDEIWYHSSSYTSSTAGNGGSNMPGGRGNSSTYYYYSVTKPNGYAYMQIYVYSASQTQGQSENYTACKQFVVNDNYDTIAVTKNGTTFSFGWTNYTTASGSVGGIGGNFSQQEGNTEQGDYSTKGIKAANSVNISAGTIQISSYDDGIHANADGALENGETSLGNVTVSGGTLALYSNDDGIHADGTVTVSGGTIAVASSYEGVEGSVVIISGGNLSVKASDDGVNGTGTKGESVVISGGCLFIYAGGDGVDSNSTTSKDGLLISGGRSVVFSTGSADSSIDTENGYKYTGGYVLAVSAGSGMSSEATNCSNFSSVATKSTLSLTKGNYVSAGDCVTVQIPVSYGSALVVYLGDNGISLKSSSSTSLTLDGNGVCWRI